MTPRMITTLPTACLIQMKTTNQCRWLQQLARQSAGGCILAQRFIKASALSVSASVRARHAQPVSVPGHAAPTPTESNMTGRSAATLMKRAQTLAAKDDESMIELAEVLWDLRGLGH